METASKLCSCPFADKHKPNCQQNFELDKAMGNAELKLAKSSALKIMTGETSSQLNVRSVLTDGDSHIARGFKEIAEENGLDIPLKSDCTRHLTKTIGREMDSNALRKGRKLRFL